MVKIAGGVVWNPKLGIVVVNQNHNSWSLPKGHVNQGEELLAAALREICEETGVPQKELKLVGKLATYERDRIKRELGDMPEMRQITLFLFMTNHEMLAPEDPMNPEARWVKIDEVSSILTHPKDKEMFELLKRKIVYTVAYVQRKQFCRQSR
ncbi:MAG: NUDIX domain-containing protein [Patescibacteria group bacterium]